MLAGGTTSFLLAQCPCSGGGGSGGASSIPPGLGAVIVFGFCFLGYWIWNLKGASVMNRIGKLAIVIVLAVVVVGVIVMKKGGGSALPPPTGSPLTSGLPRLVDLGSTTCIPCKMMAPVLEDIKTEYAGRMQVEFINVNTQPKAVKPYGIQVIPTQVFFDAVGKELWRHEGFIAKDDILAKWRELGVLFTGAASPATQAAKPAAFERMEAAQADTRAKDAICFMCDGNIDTKTLVVVKSDKGDVRLCGPHCYFIMFSCLTEDKAGFEKKVTVTDWAGGGPVPATDAVYLYGLNEKTGRPDVRAFGNKAAAVSEQRATGGNIMAWQALQEKELATRCGFCDRACYPEDAAKVQCDGVRTWGCCSHCALGVAARTGKDIEVHERDRLTGEEIVVKTVNGSVASIQPATAVAWFGLRQGSDGKFASAGCFHQGFFVSAENLAKWVQQNPLETGRLITIQQALADKMKLSPQQIQKACKIGQCAPK